MKEIINRYKDVVVQIHTPFASGSGFIMRGHEIIVTNRHVVQGNSEVVIRGENFNKTLTEVLYTDAKNDIAFLKIPAAVQSSTNIEINKLPVEAGDEILAIGHPLGLSFTATRGIVSKALRDFNDVDYIQVDAAINPGNSGGPLVNENGELAGINTFIYKEGESLGFALPAGKMDELIKEYKSTADGKRAAKCTSCTNIVTEDTLQDNYCSHCGNKFDIKEFKPVPYAPEGIADKIEQVLQDLGKDVKLARVGQTMWDIKEGSALIKISINKKNGFIYADATLGGLPKRQIKELYTFLLSENNSLQGISFSVSRQNIILGSIIHSQDFNVEIAREVFDTLFKKADYYDDVLVDQFGVIMSENV
ncbi:trypsin-like peptidase domain-containing protein [Crocinitomix catalasitica]|uniref:trypsin-like peptidase domain-containing protein n=1 Tax=Crocinitomix catalasitica TaxID=184607 RepID=UPI00056A11E6|nr:trypsin-like peptidase domain-containing protein [Crocinitomix catalasitica]